MPLRQLPEKTLRRDKILSRIWKLLILISVCANIGICIFLCFRVNNLQERINIVYDGILPETVSVWKEKAEPEPELKEIQETDKEEEAEEENMKKAYLTFDDGPSEATAEILDILKEYEVKATFFVIGKTDKNSAEMYKRIVEEGHTLAMHSYSHKYKEIYSSVKAFAEDFNKLQSLLYEITGVKPDIYRFPGGSSNSVSEIGMKEFIKYIDAKNVVYFDWNVSAGDASSKKMLSADKIVENVMCDVQKHQSAVILMHDAKGKATTLEALPFIIEKLKEEGIEIRAIDRNVKPIQHIEVKNAWIKDPEDQKTEKKTRKKPASASENAIPSEIPVVPEVPAIPEIPEAVNGMGTEGTALPGV